MVQSLTENVTPFYAQSGQEIKNAVELYEAMLSMNEAEFDHHTTHRNDFSNWIRDVHGNIALARSLERAGTKEKSAAALYKHITKEIATRAHTTRSKIQDALTNQTLHPTSDYVATHALANNLTIAGIGAFSSPGFPDPRKSPFPGKDLPLPGLKEAVQQGWETTISAVKDFIFVEDRVDETIEDIKRFHE